jgi:hypothetical protein
MSNNAYLAIPPGKQIRTTTIVLRREHFDESSFWTLRALPLTAIIDAPRANMLQGASLMQVSPQIGVLTAWLILCFTLALRLFRWR